MNRTIRGLVPTLLAAGLLLAPVSLVAAKPGSWRPTVGSPAPDFTIKLVGGGKVKLADLKGEVVILNLWATWCGPCKTEMPALDLIAINGAKHGLRIFGVVVEDNTTEYDLGKIAKVMHYPIATQISDVYTTIGRAVPTNYIIDRKGVLRYAKPAALTPEDFAKLVVPLINEAP